MARIGIIGGSGIYDPKTFEITDTLFPETEYGKPSDEILIGKMNGIEAAFLPRHGKDHRYPPHRVPYKANIAAMKELGVNTIISPCAVGSLKSKLRPGDIVIPDQFIDFTKTRDYTFFDDRTVHIAIPDPFCERLRGIFSNAANELGLRCHTRGTYVCIEGPRFSTRAESRMLRKDADIIGMTLVPECQLAREMGMCYCSIATVTDFDSWKKADNVDIQTVLDTMKASLNNVMRMLEKGLPAIDGNECACARAADEAGA